MVEKMDIDRIERLISEFIEELESRLYWHLAYTGADGSYHILNAIDLLTSALMELEELELLPEFRSEE